ncbi:MAG: hypothetical protein QOE86_1821 [Solirubrobacteraceae bacterium]|jgi:hypothetical protein|nr:hypothetical protein [Solirubrobacteraceae bacterium]
MLAVIDWGLIGQVIWVSLVMGVGVTALFSLAIYGGSRASEARRTGSGAAAAYAALSGFALLVFAAAVVFAITVILQKG